LINRRWLISKITVGDNARHKERGETTWSFRTST
jgi:hypothetical protein